MQRFRITCSLTRTPRSDSAIEILASPGPSCGKPGIALPTLVLSFFSEKSSRGAESGHGVFQTFTSIVLDNTVATDPTKLRNPPVSSKGCCKSPSNLSPTISHDPVCNQTKLATQFIPIPGPQPPTSNPNLLWGAWISLIPARLAFNHALDLATACFVAGVVAYLN
jgi:hypothetical protein